MGKVCFVCPIYDTKNHFEYGYNLVKSAVNLGVEDDLCFVFSNEEQQLRFSSETKKRFNYKIRCLLLPPELLDYKSKVVVKKLFALKQLMYEYDYISLVDCESIFLKNTNFYDLFKYIDDNDLCLNSNISYDGFFILRQCFKTLGIYENKLLRREFSNYKYNFWFNEIQVYNCSYLPAFFTWLQQFDKDGYLNEWHCFEYYLYGAFLILEEGKHLNKFKSLKSMGGIMEYLPNFKPNKQRKIMMKLDTHWTSTKESILDNTYIQFHLDRTEKDGYGYEAIPLKYKIKRLYYLMMRK